MLCGWICVNLSGFCNYLDTVHSHRRERKKCCSKQIVYNKIYMFFFSFIFLCCQEVQRWDRSKRIEQICYGKILRNVRVLLDFFLLENKRAVFFCKSLLRFWALDGESAYICAAFSCVWVFFLYASYSKLMSTRCFDAIQMSAIDMNAFNETLNRIKCRYN